MRPLYIFLTFASPPHNMSGLNLPPIDPSLRHFVTYTVDAEKFVGTATSNADRTDYRISPDIATLTGATISVNIPKKPLGEASCTAAWDSAPDEQGFVIRTSGHQTLRSLCTSVVLRNSEGTVCTAVWLQDGQEFVPPSGYQFAPGQTRTYKFPVMVIADELKLRYSPTTQSTKTSSGETEEDEWKEWDDGPHTAGVKDELTAYSGMKGPQASTAVPSRDTIY